MLQRTLALAAAAGCLTLCLLRPLGSDPPPPPLAELRAALREVAAGCPCAPQPRAAAWSSVCTALDGNPLLEAHEAGELPALQREAEWLAAGSLGARSAEDRRFLHGFLHWYLATLYAHVEGGRPLPAKLRHERPSHPQGSLREFRGLSYEDLLGLFD